MNSIKRQKDTTPKDEPPRSEGVHMLMGKSAQAITKRYRRNEEDGSKQKLCSVVDVSGGESKIRCCIEQYCIGIWNVRYMNQGKLKLVKRR